MNYLLTGRNVKLTKEQREACSKRYVSIRALAYKAGKSVTSMITATCSPDKFGALPRMTLIVRSDKDFMKDPKTGKNEVMQFLHYGGNQVTVYKLLKNGTLRLLKKRGEQLVIDRLLRETMTYVQDFKLALVRNKSQKPEFEDWYPTCIPGAYAQEYEQALSQVIKLLKRKQLVHLSLAADSWTTTVQYLLYLARESVTIITLTWVRPDGKLESNTWFPGDDWDEFLAGICELNVYRFETIDEHGIRVVRYTKPNPQVIDPYPVVHTNDEPEEFDERMRQLGYDPEMFVSYEWMYEAANADDQDAAHKVRHGRYGELTPVDYKITYRPTVVPGGTKRFERCKNCILRGTKLCQFCKLHK